MRRHQDSTASGRGPPLGHGWSPPHYTPLPHIYGYHAPPTRGYGGLSADCGPLSPALSVLSSRYPHRRCDTTSTMSDRFSRAVTSPPRMPDPVVFNAGFTFRINEERPKVYDHVKVDPASSVPHTQSFSLTKQIDRFLKKSDHCLDRYQNILQAKKLHPETVVPRQKSVPPPKPPRSGRSSESREFSKKEGSTESSNSMSLSLTGIMTPSLINSPPLSCASMATTAERHRRILSKVVANGIARRKRQKEELSSSTSSTSSSDDDFESDSGAHHTSSGLYERSDDTSAEISKLEDLSSGSDDEYFDVHPLPGFYCVPSRPPLVENGLQKGDPKDSTQVGRGAGRVISSIQRSSIGVPSTIRTPIHSQSLPAVNKIKFPFKMGNTPPIPQGTETNACQEMQPIKSHKKYPAPPPPASREPSFISVSSQSPRGSIDGSQIGKQCISLSVSGLSVNTLESYTPVKKPQRTPSIKKYPAPQPPSIPQGETITFTTNSLPRDHSRRNTFSETMQQRRSLTKTISENPIPGARVVTERPGSPIPNSSTTILPIRLKPDTHNKTELDTPLTSQTSNQSQNSCYVSCENLPAVPIPLSTDNISNNNSNLQDSKLNDLKSNVDCNVISNNPNAGIVINKTPSYVGKEKCSHNPTSTGKVLKNNQHIIIENGVIDGSPPFKLSNKSEIINENLKTKISVESSLKSVKNNNVLNLNENCVSNAKVIQQQQINGLLIIDETENCPLKTIEKIEASEPKILNENISSTPDSLTITKDNLCEETLTKNAKIPEATLQTNEDSEKTKILMKSTDDKDLVTSNQMPTNNKVTLDVTEALSHSRQSSVSKDSISSRGSRANSVSSTNSENPDLFLPKNAIKKSRSSKLLALANKFECDDKSNSSKDIRTQSVKSNMNKGPSKLSRNKISGLANIFGGDVKSKEVGKLQSPYSKPFSPESSESEFSKKSINGIDVSKFGGVASQDEFRMAAKKPKVKIESKAKKVIESKISTESSPVSSNVDIVPVSVDNVSSTAEVRKIESVISTAVDKNSDLINATAEADTTKLSSGSKRKKLKKKQDATELKIENKSATTVVDPNNKTDLSESKSDSVTASINNANIEQSEVQVEVDKKKQSLKHPSLLNNTVSEEKSNLTNIEISSATTKDKPNVIHQPTVGLNLVQNTPDNITNESRLHSDYCPSTITKSNISKDNVNILSDSICNDVTTIEMNSVKEDKDKAQILPSESLTETAAIDTKLSESKEIDSVTALTPSIIGSNLADADSCDAMESFTDSHPIKIAVLLEEMNPADATPSDVLSPKPTSLTEEASVIVVAPPEKDSNIADSNNCNLIESSAESHLIQVAMLTEETKSVKVADSDILSAKPALLTAEVHNNLIESIEPANAQSNSKADIKIKEVNTETRIGATIPFIDSTVFTEPCNLVQTNAILTVINAHIQPSDAYTNKSLITSDVESSDTQHSSVITEIIPVGLNTETVPSVLKSEITGSLVNSEIIPITVNSYIAPGSSTVDHTETAQTVVNTNLSQSVVNTEIPPTECCTEISQTVENSEMKETLVNSEKDAITVKAEINDNIANSEVVPTIIKTEVTPICLNTEIASAIVNTEISSTVVNSEITEAHLNLVNVPVEPTDVNSNKLPTVDINTEIPESLVHSEVMQTTQNAEIAPADAILKMGSTTVEILPSFTDQDKITPAVKNDEKLLPIINAQISSPDGQPEIIATDVNTKFVPTAIVSTLPTEIASLNSEVSPPPPSTRLEAANHDAPPLNEENTSDLSSLRYTISSIPDQRPNSEPNNVKDENREPSPVGLFQGMVNTLKHSLSKVMLHTSQQIDSGQFTSADSQDKVADIPNVEAHVTENKWYTSPISSSPEYHSANSSSHTVNSMDLDGMKHELDNNKIIVTEETGARSKRSSKVVIPDEVLNVSEILREAEERLTKALEKDPLVYRFPIGKTDEAYIDAFDPSQFDILMPLPVAEDMNLLDRRSRSSTPYREGLDRRSPTPKRIVEQTEAILTETDRILRKTRSHNSLRRSFTRSMSGMNLNRLTEVTADLTEEHSTSHLAGERIEAEQAERMRLEKEVNELQTEVKKMTDTNDKLEMERLALRTEMLHVELNGDIHDSDDAAEAALYKRKYEWSLRELEVLKKQLKQQQEDDLDQLLLLKKQLEKKIGDSHEETEEQRQVATQLKKKSQRLQAEMNDMKILLEEQTSRNNLLEKKQRKFDQDIHLVQEELRNEKLTKDKIQREKDQTFSEKYSFEQEVATLKLELELKDEKVAALTREINDLNFTGKAEEEVAILKKAKHDLELRVKDQEEELDDLAGQVQMLEGARLRLEMSLEQMRKENRKEAQQREEEMEEVRLSAQKKVKAFEAQLESEHDERTQLLREKHELERRLALVQERTFASVDEDAFHRVKRELKKTKALLKDTQTMLEKTQSEGSNKLLLRQLKTQLEDAEFAKTAAIKARQSAESEASEVQSQLEEVLRAKNDAEERCVKHIKEKTEMQSQLEEGEEEVAEVMKKYKAAVSQLSIDQINIAEQTQIIAELEHDKQVLQERLSEMSSKVVVLEEETANIRTQSRLQMKIKELESKLELESTTRQRLDSQITRLKDQLERLSSECDSAKAKEAQAFEFGKKLNRQLREAKEDLGNIQQKQTDAISKKQEIEKQYELAESEIITLKSDLKLAFKRIEDLQQALQGDLSDSDSELTDSESESETSLTSYLTTSVTQDRLRPNSSTHETAPEGSSESKMMDLMVCSPTNDLMMSSIREDMEDDYKESFA